MEPGLDFEQTFLAFERKRLSVSCISPGRVHDEHTIPTNAAVAASILATIYRMIYDRQPNTHQLCPPSMHQPKPARQNASPARST